MSYQFYFIFSLSEKWSSGEEEEMKFGKVGTWLIVYMLKKNIECRRFSGKNSEDWFGLLWILYVVTLIYQNESHIHHLKNMYQGC